MESYCGNCVCAALNACHAPVRSPLRKFAMPSRFVNVGSFGITLSAEDLGQLLDAFGFTGMIAGGTTGVEFKGQWQGSPGAFSLARAEGKLEGKVGQGRILEVNPGAGRFFGLLSLSAIPRRLSLDFSDFFKSGFSLISSAKGYENPEWLMHTNAPDRGRDLSVTRVVDDPLAGVRRSRVLIQCKHWTTKSVSVGDVRNGTITENNVESALLAAVIGAVRIPTEAPCNSG